MLSLIKVFSVMSRMVLIIILLEGTIHSQTTVNQVQIDLVEKWVETWGEKWWERYHEDYVAQYPGGKTNKAHDLVVQESLKGNQENAWQDWKISNQIWMFDADWFAVEWFYEAHQPSTGFVQIESTLAFGRIADDHLITWIEYFDDMIGRMQSIGAMKLFDKELENPFPWPENTSLRRKYRP